MRSICEAINYYEGETPPIPGSGYVANIPPAVAGPVQLFDALFNVLNLPGYFGFNWNALSDCLRDLSWISERKVVIVHSDVPCLVPDDIKLYLEILCEAVHDWKPGEDHELFIYFPASCRGSIATFLAESGR